MLKEKVLFSLKEQQKEMFKKKLSKLKNKMMNKGIFINNFKFNNEINHFKYDLFNNLITTISKEDIADEILEIIKAIGEKEGLQVFKSESQNEIVCSYSIHNQNLKDKAILYIDSYIELYNYKKDIVVRGYIRNIENNYIFIVQEDEDMYLLKTDNSKAWYIQYLEE